MISEEMLSLLAKAIAQKSKSFLRYGELERYLSDHDKFRQVLVEIILREQKHFETLNEIISQLVAGEGQYSALETATGHAADDNKCDGASGRIDIVLLNRLVEAKRSLSRNDNYNVGSVMPLAEGKRNIDGETVSDVSLSAEKMPAEAELMPEKQTGEKVQRHGENNVPEETLLSVETRGSEEFQSYSMKETGRPFQQEEPSGQCTPEQSRDVSSREGELLVWTFGQTQKKDI